MSTVHSYARPETPLQVSTCHPRPLDPLEALPNSYSSPKNPETPTIDFTSLYTRTTHIIPAAYPRMTSALLETDYPPTPSNESKEERKLRVKNLAAAFLKKRLAVARGVGDGELAKQSPVLFNSIHRYARKESQQTNSDGVTLVFAHANGFNKEVWEPTLRKLLKVSQVPIDEIWSFEAVNHGDSARINDGKLGDLYSWADNARDILNLLINYLPSRPSYGLSVPKFLEKVSPDEVDQRHKVGFRHRNIVGVGHSLGGCSMARAAVEVPSLWASMVLADPVMLPNLLEDPSGGTAILALGALSRRSEWKSKQEALATFKASPFFQAWDPRVLEIYVEDGLYEDEKGIARLKTTGIQEATVFSERTLPFETWELLERLDERIPLRWVMAGKKSSGGNLGSEEIVGQTVWRRPNNSSNISLEGVGHLIVHEAPEILGEEIANFLQIHHIKSPSQVQARL